MDYKQKKIIAFYIFNMALYVGIAIYYIHNKLDFEKEDHKKIYVVYIMYSVIDESIKFILIILIILALCNKKNEISESDSTRMESVVLTVNDDHLSSSMSELQYENHLPNALSVSLYKSAIN
jgi:hypothetical protein